MLHGSRKTSCLNPKCNCGQVHHQAEANCPYPAASHGSANFGKQSAADLKKIDLHTYYRSNIECFVILYRSNKNSTRSCSGPTPNDRSCLLLFRTVFVREQDLQLQVERPLSEAKKPSASMQFCGSRHSLSSGNYACARDGDAPACITFLYRLGK